MIIKYYSLGIPGKLFILDNAANIVVHSGLAPALTNGPDVETIDLHLAYDEDDKVHGKWVQFIDFTAEGVRHRLAVYGKAYVCSDAGKTIEAVDPTNGFEHAPCDMPAPRVIPDAKVMA